MLATIAMTASNSGRSHFLTTRNTISTLPQHRPRKELRFSSRELLSELSPNMTSFARMDGPTADLYRRVLLDIFHLIDRIKVPMHHSFKKAFFAAYR